MDDSTSDLALYHYDSCPFCVRVRQVADSLGLQLELRNVQLDMSHRQDLIEGGGSSQVPCLRIERPEGQVRWLYESADISHYLNERFGRSRGA